jgi:hypothetical protein
MVIAPQHAKGEGIGSGKNVEERLLLYWVYLKASDIAARDVEHPFPIETHLANPPPTLRDEAAVTTGITADSIILQPLVELTRTSEAI